MKHLSISVLLSLASFQSYGTNSTSKGTTHETVLPRLSEMELLNDSLARADALRQTGQYAEAILVVQGWLNNNAPLVSQAHERIARFWNGKGENELVKGRPEEALNSFQSAIDELRKAENFATSAADKEPLALQRYFNGIGRWKAGQNSLELKELRHEAKELAERAIQENSNNDVDNELIARFKHELAFLLSHRPEGGLASELELNRAMQLYQEAKQYRKEGQRAMTSSRLWVVAAHLKSFDLAMTELMEASLFYRENFDQQRLYILKEDIASIRLMEGLDQKFIDVLAGEASKVEEAIRFRE